MNFKRFAAIVAAGVAAGLILRYLDNKNESA